MSDESFADFRKADSRFSRGILNGDVTPRERAAVARAVELEPLLFELRDAVARPEGKRR
jgi:hypothetical protein